MLPLVILMHLAAPRASAQVVIQGRLHARDDAVRADEIPLSTVLAIGALPGSAAEAISFRTWESHPAGWFRLTGAEGRYTLAFTNPAHFLRPRILTNQFVRDGDSLDLRLRATFDFACFHDEAWDPEPARRYVQPFFARGTSVTSVGFKLATDGVDGAGPGKQDVLISVHRRDPGEPESWPQVGPAATVAGVDCGGPKSYWYSAGWNSGEVPVEPGLQYAISLRPASPDGRFQAFWRPRAGGSPGIYRLGDASRGYEPFDIWLAVASDGDGLVIPYAKRVHARFHALTTLERKWSQTWVAAGRGLASVVLYAAVSGTQPPLNRQRVRVRVRAGGPRGDVAGVEKIAVGNGDYTGDASWGHFVAVFAPGEVVLEPGSTYAIEFESIESLDTIGGFVNIKGEVSDGRAGFNPYRKCPPDEYPHGQAFARGTDERDFDLDLQIVEYEHVRGDWDEARAGRELLADLARDESGNGSGDGSAPADTNSAGGDSPGNRGGASPWQTFRLGEGTSLERVAADEHAGGGSLLRVVAASGTERSIDGGQVRCIRGLDRAQTYRLSGRVRATWPASVDRNCAVGLDATGQTEDASAATIEWTVLPPRHGEFLTFTSRPVRPVKDAVSIWLRARSAQEDARFPFRAEFAAFSLRRVDRGVPVPQERGARRGFIDDVPPETAGARDARLALVRERRAHTPVLVHRGASRFAPENTLEAYAAALDRGADGIEVDIRRSRDGILYAFHDDTLERMTDRTGAVRGLSYFELLDCQVGGGPYRIPTLAAVFTLARDRALLLHLDVKEPGLEPEILRLIGDADLWEHIVSVNDYNAASIREHERVTRLAYKGWFPQGETPDAPPADDLAEAQRRFLEQAGDMVFTKDDPLDAVRALGRSERQAQAVPAALRVEREESGPAR